MKRALIFTASLSFAALAGTWPALSQAQVFGGSGALGGSIGGSLGSGVNGGGGLAGSVTGQADLDQANTDLSGIDNAAQRDARTAHDQAARLRNDAGAAASVDTHAGAAGRGARTGNLRGMIDAQADVDANVRSGAVQSTVRDGMADARSDATSVGRQARTTSRGVAGTTGNVNVGADVSASGDVSADTPH